MADKIEIIKMLESSTLQEDNEGYSKNSSQSAKTHFILRDQSVPILFGELGFFAAVFDVLVKLTRTTGEAKIPSDERYRTPTTPISNGVIEVGFQMLLKELMGVYGFVLN